MVTAPGNKVIFLGGSSLSLLHLTTLIPFLKKCKKIASSVEIKFQYLAIQHKTACCHYHGSLVIFVFSNQIELPILLLQKRKPSVDFICFCKRLDFSASTTEQLQLPPWICAVSDAYPQGRPMQASTSCQDTERRI